MDLKSIGWRKAEAIGGVGLKPIEKGKLKVY